MRCYFAISFCGQKVAQFEMGGNDVFGIVPWESGHSSKFIFLPPPRWEQKWNDASIKNDYEIMFPGRKRQYFSWWKNQNTVLFIFLGTYDRENLGKTLLFILMKSLGDLKTMKAQKTTIMTERMGGNFVAFGNLLTFFSTLLPSKNIICCGVALACTNPRENIFP